MKKTLVTKALIAVVSLGALGAGATAWYYQGPDNCPIRKAVHAPGTQLASNSTGTSDCCASEGKTECAEGSTECAEASKECAEHASETAPAAESSDH